MSHSTQNPISTSQTHDPHLPLGQSIAGGTQTALSILSPSSSDASIKWSWSAWIFLCLSKWTKVTGANCYQRLKRLIIIMIKNPNGMSAESRPCSRCGMFSKPMWRGKGEGHVTRFKGQCVYGLKKSTIKISLTCERQMRHTANVKDALWGGENGNKFSVISLHYSLQSPTKISH